MARKDVRVGDTVLIEKGGDVIPKVVEVVLEKRPDGHACPGRRPTTCPVCGTHGREGRGRGGPPLPERLLPRAGGGAAQALRAARRPWTSRAWATCSSRQLVEKGLVKDFADLYALALRGPGAAVRAEGMKRRIARATNLARRRSRRARRASCGACSSASASASWASARPCSWRGTSGASRRSATASVEEIDALYEIGPAVAASRCTTGSPSAANQQPGRRLEEAGVRTPRRAAAAARSRFQGMQFVLTGASRR